MDDATQKKVFAENLNRLLHENQKSQKDLADAIHEKRTTVNNWCKGVALPRMGKIQRIADYFYVPKTLLIEINGKEESRTVANRVLQYYSRLNEQGREKVESYMEDLVGNDKYTKKDDAETE